MDPYTKRINNIDDFSKLYAELKSLNRLMESHPEQEFEIKQKKQLVEQRLQQLMYIVAI
ncbi:hypothetical protein [Ammoniphilus sp. YIM 78166]|uniref:hypothetical protein n=1 Tax=Ammoniphilus sp. YIM 78166 TaxID=1644106 RepID=UPI0014303C69|nr:hypothetical protein [Ammoniphilus sp. YIM 78166]